MKIGFIGLGKMGEAMVARLLEDGHEVVAYDPNPTAVERATAAGATGAASLVDLAAALPTPRLLWVMVPHGAPVDAVLQELGPTLAKGDVVIDGGNSHYTDSQQRATSLAAQGVEYLDVGTSGGLSGARHGACLMVGGTAPAVEVARPVFETLAQPGGFAHLGPSGAGHYAKMVHNGVEYAMVQAYGEGLSLLRNAPAPFDFDLEQVARNWNHGSVVRSWVLELAAEALANDPDLKGIGENIGGGSTGEWTLQAAMESQTPVPAIYAALAERYASRTPESFTAKVVAALRHQWGGHAVDRK
jgi:6-phosphogluconate dehydrogenase